MSDMSFDEHKISQTSSSGPKGLVGFLINKCGVGDESTANIILVVVAVVIFAVAGFIMYGALK